MRSKSVLGNPSFVSIQRIWSGWMGASTSVEKMVYVVVWIPPKECGTVRCIRTAPKRVVSLLRVAPTVWMRGFGLA